MKFSLFIGFLFFASTANSQIIIDSFRVIFPANKTLYLFNDTIKRFTPTIIEIEKADSIAKLNNSLKNEIKNYESYFKQYVGLIIKNEKNIFINAVCVKFECFFTNICDAKGGGGCFFKVQIDLGKQYAFDFRKNAPK
ncbi:MAG: hypothetical protein JWO92_1602 [Chitinophagaceae bacterium]|nr:hypothetical protein [Chitinophagaceae bacterium]